MQEYLGADEVIQNFYKENPLVTFSIYSHIQGDIVRELGDELLKLLDDA